MWKKIAFVVVLILSGGLTNISYATCTPEEYASKVMQIMASIESNIPADQYDHFETQIEAATDFYDQGKTDEACQIFDDLIEEYNLPMPK